MFFSKIKFFDAWNLQNNSYKKTLRTSERRFQRKDIGYAAEKQFWKGLRIEDFLQAGHKCTV